MQQRLRLTSNNFRAGSRAVAAPIAEIVVFRAVDTPLGRLYWNPNKAWVASFSGFVGAGVGLFAGAYLGLSLGEGLGPALLSLATSAVTAAVFALNALRA